MIVKDAQLLGDTETAIISSGRKGKLISNSQLASIAVHSPFPEKQLVSSYRNHHSSNLVDPLTTTKYETQIKPITSVGR